MRAHIGNAYMMMGGYAEALEWFTAACDEPDVKLLMAENRAACLQRMDAERTAGGVRDVETLHAAG